MDTSSFSVRGEAAGGAAVLFMTTDSGSSSSPETLDWSSTTGFPTACAVSVPSPSSVESTTVRAKSGFAPLAGRSGLLPSDATVETADSTICAVTRPGMDTPSVSVRGEATTTGVSSDLTDCSGTTLSDAIGGTANLTTCAVARPGMSVTSSVSGCGEAAGSAPACFMTTDSSPGRSSDREIPSSVCAEAKSISGAGSGAEVVGSAFSKTGAFAGVSAPSGKVVAGNGTITSSVTAEESGASPPREGIGGELPFSLPPRPFRRGDPELWSATETE